jgi:Fe2+ or Zn2+ uptake regulation protein
MQQKVVLVCEECGTKSDAKPQTDLVDDGWNWQEFEIEDAGIERVALCSDCFDPEKLADAIEDYRETRIKQNKELTDYE